MSIVQKQNIEFKEIWKDEYLKWICGMANAKGGTIYIGKMMKKKILIYSVFRFCHHQLPTKSKKIRKNIL